MEIILSIFIGIGLAAAVGFRIFIPFLIVSVAAYTDNLQLSTYFSWIGTLPALITFGAATLIEIFSYYIPWVDNFLDAVSHPLAILAGIILAGAVVTDFPPLIKWALALIAGGGIAGTVHAATGMIRLKSSALTGGAGNPVVSTAEAGSSIVLSLISIFIPALGVIIVGLIVVTLSFIIKKRFLSPPPEV